jgi:hypothetical protein
MSNQQVSLRLKVMFKGAFSRPSHLLWFIGVGLVAPMALLSLGGDQSNNLPWYFWVLSASMVVAVIGLGIWRFTHKSDDAGAISISPDRH